MIINEGTERETLERHFLCRAVTDLEIALWRVLCAKCRNSEAIETSERMSYSELPCDQCGTSWKPPPGVKAMKCKDRLVTITARYPDLETARNNVS